MITCWYMQNQTKRKFNISMVLQSRGNPLNNMFELENKNYILMKKVSNMFLAMQEMEVE